MAYQEIASDVFCIDHRVADGKNGLVIGTRGTLVIDTGTYPEEGQAIADLARARGRTASHLTYTHGHADHVMGSAVFKGAEIIANTVTPAEMLRTLPRAAERMGISSEDARDQIAWPTLTFARELQLDLGSKNVRLFPAPGHSADAIAVYVEQDRLLFAGDTVVTSIVPAIGDGDGRALVTSLQRLLALDIDIVVPGHGAVLVGKARVQDWLQWLCSYLNAVRHFVRASLDQGLGAAAIADKADYERFIGHRLPIDRHSMPMRHRNTVEKIIQEETQAC